LLQLKALFLTALMRTRKEMPVFVPAYRPLRGDLENSKLVYPKIMASLIKRMCEERRALKVRSRNKQREIRN